MTPKFSPGANIAIKVPSHEYDSTVNFYQHVLGLEKQEIAGVDDEYSVVFDFDGKNLWVDNASTVSQSEVWLEIQVNDAKAAERHFAEHNIRFRNDIEILPTGYNGFWIASPANTIHLISEFKSD